MRDLAAAAQALRGVRMACRHFLHLWAIEHIARRPAAIDRLLTDVLEAEPANLKTSTVTRHTQLGLHRARELDDEW